jgi:hypothetical protein
LLSILLPTSIEQYATDTKITWISGMIYGILNSLCAQVVWYGLGHLPGMECIVPWYYSSLGDYRQDGMQRLFDQLAVLWVDHYDNVTPALLRESYPKILANAQEYNLAKLTNQWWADCVNSYRPLHSDKK